MSKHRYVKFFGIVAVIIALAVGVMVGTSHKAFAQLSTTTTNKVAHADPNNCMDYKPWGVNVASCWQVVDTVGTGWGLNIGCISDGDPLGYYTTSTRYIGWSFTDTAGNRYTDHDSQGNQFPYSLATIINSYDCGLPA